MAIRHQERQVHPIAKVLDRAFIAQAGSALENGEAVTIEAKVHSSDRTVGAMLSGEVAKRYGHEGLPDDTITVKLKGTAGQSFGAWLAARRDAQPRRRGQRLCRQGPVGRQDHHRAVVCLARLCLRTPSSSATR